MRTIWHSLIWKEWHEHKWKFVSIVAILWGTAVLALTQGGVDAFGLATGMVTFCVVPLAVFVGLGVAANERSRGTFGFMQALPAPVWRIALIKLLMGLFILLASVVLTLPVFYVGSHFHEIVAFGRRPNAVISRNPYFDIFLMCAPLAASLFIWSAATGVNRKDEVSAGATALAVMVGWYFALLLLGYLMFGWWDESTARSPQWRQVVAWITALGFSTAPAGFMPAFGTLDSNRQEMSNDLWFRFMFVIVTIASVTHLALAGWYLRRFGRVSNLSVRSPQVAARERSRLDWLGTPRRSALTAIVWKQIRESGPLILAGLAGMVGIILLILICNWRDFLSHRDQLAGVASAVIVAFGYAIALIVGIGVCFYDVSPQLNTFWRSRPINSDLWFWCKFATGLIVLMAALYIPLLLVVFTTHPHPSQLLLDEQALVFPTAHLATFAAAVAVTCLVRHAVYGAILSIPLLYAGVLAVLAALNVAGFLGWIPNAPSRLMEMSSAQVASGFMLTFVISTILAWLAMRNDWGRKSRY